MLEDFTPNERRRHDRVGADLPVKLHLGGGPRSGTIRQISHGGAFIETEMARQLKAGDTLTLWLRFDGLSELESVEAKVIYAKKNYELETGARRDGLGVSFSKLSPHMEQALGQLIDTQRQAGRLIYDSKGKRAVEAAWKLSQFLRAVVDTESALLVVLDENGNVVLWNQAAEEITGYTRGEVLDSNRLWQLLFPDPEQRTTMADGLAAVVESGTRVDQLETITITKQGARRCISWDLRPLVEQGSFIGLLALGYDVTERREIEAQLRQAQKLEAVGRLAGGIAHDFNNILTAIIGYCEMLSAAPDEGSTLLTSIEGINNCANRGSELTRQLLAFGRRQIMSPIPLNLVAVVEETRSMLEPLVGEDLKLLTSFAAEPWFILADPVQVQQVIVNLVLNARDAMPLGGDVHITTENIVVDDDLSARHDAGLGQPYVVLSVKDQGCGMSEELLSKIFEPFFTTKEPGQGTGLGLSTVYGIVKQSDGFVRVHSELGLGSTFEVFFPRCVAASVVPHEPGDRLRPPSGRETILLVEDDPAVREVLTESLVSHGYVVLAAQDAVEAERLAAENDFDAMVTDVVLPGLAGPSLAKRIRQTRPDLKVLFMSGHTERAANLGTPMRPGKDFLQKPFRPSDLLRELRKLIDREQDPSR